MTYKQEYIIKLKTSKSPSGGVITESKNPIPTKFQAILDLSKYIFTFIENGKIIEVCGLKNPEFPPGIDSDIFVLQSTISNKILYFHRKKYNSETYEMASLQDPDGNGYEYLTSKFMEMARNKKK